MDFDRNEPLLMGILNVTPDSFYDGGEYNRIEAAVERGRAMVEAGADIIDVGGESTRPGADPVPSGEERDRVVPVVKALRDRITVPISVDTSKPEVARASLEEGAGMVNVVTGLENSRMIELVAESGCHVVIMHMQGSPRTMQESPGYEDVVADVKQYLKQQAIEAEERGIPSDRILVDPGIGFGKTLEHNRRLLAGIEDLKSLGYPVLVGHSRKSFLEGLLGEAVDDRLSGTLAVSSELVRRGVDVLRVHDVRDHDHLRRVHHWMNQDAGGEERD